MITLASILLSLIFLRALCKKIGSGEVKFDLNLPHFIFYSKVPNEATGILLRFKI